jgi:hypothetical protein
MVSRAVYTPGTAAAVTILQSSSSSTPSQPPNSTHDSHEETGRRTAFVSQVLQIVANNKGLLLVAAAQLFFSVMNLMVKKLNSLDPPVPTLEVFYQSLEIM